MNGCRHLKEDHGWSAILWLRLLQKTKSGFSTKPRSREIFCVSTLRVPAYVTESLWLNWISVVPTQDSVFVKIQWRKNKIINSRIGTLSLRSFRKLPGLFSALLYCWRHSNPTCTTLSHLLWCCILRQLPPSVLLSLANIHLVMSLNERD